MNLPSAINQAMDRSGGQLKTAAQELSDLIERYPELRYQVAASLVVMMIQPAFDAHREAWEDIQGSDMSEVITSLWRK